MSQLHEPGAASMPSVLVGGSEEDANPEQLTRKDNIRSVASKFKFARLLG